MTFPSNTIQTTHLDSDFDFIGLARPEIYHNFTVMREIIDSYAQPEGICPLSDTGQIPALHMPTEFTSSISNPIMLLPGNSVVHLESILALTPVDVGYLHGATAPAGSIALCSDGDAGAICVAVATGETITEFGTLVPEWKRISLGAAVSTSS